MTKLRITYKKSAIGYSKEQKETVRALGLRKLNSIALHNDTPAIRGMAFKVRHLVGVEEVADTETAPARRTPAAQPTRVAFAPAAATEQAVPAAQPATSVAAPVQAAQVAPSPVAVAPVVQPVSAAAPAASTTQDTPADDLVLIEGIGPKIAEVLAAEGITTFAQLASTDVERLGTILQAANLRLAKPDTWPEQAALAAAGKWDEFKALTENLKAGQRV